MKYEDRVEQLLKMYSTESKLSVSEEVPATYDAAGFGALTFTAVPDSAQRMCMAIAHLEEVVGVYEALAEVRKQELEACEKELATVQGKYNYAIEYISRLEAIGV